jgi:protein-L-isoaspartate(D-aspartate) O-methyltransferase
MAMKRVAATWWWVCAIALVLGCCSVAVGEGDSKQDKKKEWQPPKPPGAAQFVEERKRMVEKQMAASSGHSMPVRSKVVLDAMRIVPRHVFVPSNLIRHAYKDGPLPIGFDQTISQPYIVAKMTELLRVKRGSRVLEIGKGSGYQAAVLGQITEHVYTIEIVEGLGKRADQVLREQGYDSIQRKIGDGYKGWPEAAPFDGIIVTCAAEELPEPLWEQLKPGGRIVIPIGEKGKVQRLVFIVKTEEGKRVTRTVMLVRFVPMTGEGEK